MTHEIYSIFQSGLHVTHGTDSSVALIINTVSHITQEPQELSCSHHQGGLCLALLGCKRMMTPFSLTVEVPAFAAH